MKDGGTEIERALRDELGKLLACVKASMRLLESQNR